MTIIVNIDPSEKKEQESKLLDEKDLTDENKPGVVKLLPNRQKMLNAAIRKRRLTGLILVLLLVVTSAIAAYFVLSMVTKSGIFRRWQKFEGEVNMHLLHANGGQKSAYMKYRTNNDFSVHKLKYNYKETTILTLFKKGLKVIQEEQHCLIKNIIGFSPYVDVTKTFLRNGDTEITITKKVQQQHYFIERKPLHPRFIKYQLGVEAERLCRNRITYFLRPADKECPESELDCNHCKNPHPYTDMTGCPKCRCRRSISFQNVQGFQPRPVIDKKPEMENIKPVCKLHKIAEGVTLAIDPDLFVIDYVHDCSKVLP